MHIVVGTAARDVRRTVCGVHAVGRPASGCNAVWIVIDGAGITLEIFRVWECHSARAECGDCHGIAPIAVVGTVADCTHIELVCGGIVQVLHCERMRASRDNRGLRTIGIETVSTIDNLPGGFGICRGPV